VRAVNVVGLRRRGVPEASIERLRAAYRQLFAGREPLARALRDIDRGDPYVARLVRALESPPPRGEHAAAAARGAER